MIVSAWNNSGEGFGLKIKKGDRDENFDREWNSIILVLEGYDQEVEVNIHKPSFWGTQCRELIKKEIGEWLKANNNHKWCKGKPPQFIMENIEQNRFSVMLDRRMK